MKRRYWFPSVLLVTVGGLGAQSYYNQAGIFHSTASAGNGAALSAITDKQDKARLAFESAGIITDYKRCHWTRAQLNRVESGKGDEHFKCEELKSYVEPSERLIAASSQGLVKNCEQAIKAALWDPESYRFVNRLYVASENNGVDVRLSYSESDGFGRRDQWQANCSYKL